MRTRSSSRLTAFAGAAALALTIVPVAPVQAVGSINWSSGSYVRQRIWEHSSGGAVITVFGSSPCTATTSDTETVMSNMVNQGWNDIASAANSYNSCSLNIYRDINFGGDSTGYRWYSSSSPVYLGDIWNDQASSFKLS